jgi:hypothetical protein
MTTLAVLPSVTNFLESRACRFAFTAGGSMAASIRTMETLIGKPGEFALENRRFCTMLFEPSPNQFMVNRGRTGSAGPGRQI